MLNKIRGLVATLATFLAILVMYNIAGPGAQWAVKASQTDDFIMIFLGALMAVVASLVFALTLGLFELFERKR